MKRERVAELHFYEWRATTWAVSETRDRLDAAGRGIYRELLDQCYTQGKFPDDVEWGCRRCACTLGEWEKTWPKIERHFPISNEFGYRWNLPANIVRREFFAFIKQQSENGKNKRLRKANEINDVERLASTKTKGRQKEDNTIQENTHTGACAPPPFAPIVVKRVPPPLPSSRFSDWWARYPLKSGESGAFASWDGLVSLADEAHVFACLDRYLASDQVARGVVKSPLNWLRDCAADGWRTDWPPVSRAPNGKASTVDRAMERIGQRLAKGERPL